MLGKTNSIKAALIRRSIDFIMPRNFILESIYNKFPGFSSKVFKAGYFYAKQKKSSGNIQYLSYLLLECPRNLLPVFLERPKSQIAYCLFH